MKGKSLDITPLSGAETRVGAFGKLRAFGKLW